MATVSTTAPVAREKPLRIGLWVAQALLFVAYCASGFVKLTASIQALSAMMPWTGQLPELFVRMIGLVDLAGGIGIMLPALTRIQPRLTVMAALGCTVLQVLAIGFHVARGEFQVLPLNLVLISLSGFIFWGRSRRAQIASR